MKENHPKSNRPFSLYLLVILMIFQSVGAIGGGLALVIRPSGTLIQMPLSMLEHSPFPNFLIPGLFLLIVLGLLPACECYALLKKPACQFCTRLNPEKEVHWAWSLSFFIGIVLILWIDLEVMFLRSVALLHLIYALLGVAIVVVTVWPSTRRYFKS
ncbi:MAG: hypothetical protein V1681_10040 [Candidatus Neomarinimicrobiota bacterium]